jgi:hypothetical protein
MIGLLLFILPILEMIGNCYWKYNSPNNRHIIAKLFIKWGEARFPPYPPCSFRVIANIGNDWELECNINSPNNRHIVAKIFYK